MRINSILTLTAAVAFCWTGYAAYTAPANGKGHYDGAYYENASGELVNNQVSTALMDWGSPRQDTYTEKEVTTWYPWVYNLDTKRWGYDKESWDNVYFAKITVPYGSSFTIWTVTENGQDVQMDVNVYAPTPEMAWEYYSSPMQLDDDWDGNHRWRILPGEWYDNDAGKNVPFLVAIRSWYIGETLKVRYQLADVPDHSAPKGDALNPDDSISISGTATSTTTTKEFPASQWGDRQMTYEFSVNLEKSYIYIFKTTSGSKDDLLSLDLGLPSGSTITNEPNVVRVDSDVGNDEIRVVPLQSGSYRLTVTSLAAKPDKFTLQYGRLSGRLPADHDIKAALSPGVPVSFSPGRIVKSGSIYMDDTIDECLFSFRAVAGSTYRFTTQGARASVLMRLYDSNGTMLAETSERSSEDMDAFLVRRFAAEGTYYVGVCEKLANDATDPLSGQTISVLLEDVSDATGLLDAWDRADDAANGASGIVPVLTESTADPARVDVHGHGPHRLSATDGEDFFALAARTDFTYKVQLKADGAFETAGWFLYPQILSAEGSEMPASRSGDVYSFVAPSVGTYFICVRVAWSAADGSVVLVPGAESPEYSLHACAYSPDADDYGFITVVPKGTSADADVKWRFGSDESTWYSAGVYALAKGAVELFVSDVPGYSTPSSFTARVAPGGSMTDAVATYKDTFDPADDIMGGATPISIADVPASFSRTMWRASESGPADTNDWFSFVSREGVYYEFEFTSIEDADPGVNSARPAFYIYDSAGILRAKGTDALSWAASSSGTNYLCIAKDGVLPPECDCSYTFSAMSVDVGAVKFLNPSVVVSEGDLWAEVSVYRTSAGGSVSVNWGTVRDSALAGVDYVPSSGTLTWQKGDSGAKTVRVKLIPPLRPASEGDRSFAVRLWPVELDEKTREGGEYEAVVADPNSAKVTIEASAPQSGASRASFGGWGDSASGFADPDHPEIVVAPGQEVRLWVERLGGSNGALDVTASVYGDVTCCSLASSRVFWGSGESGAKWIGLRISKDVSEDTTAYVRLDPTGDGAALFGARRVVIRVDASASPTETSERTAQALALMPFAGRYTVALVPESGTGPSLSKANGWLEFELETNGLAAVSGRLPDGTSVDAEAPVLYTGDLLAPDSGIAEVMFSDALLGSIFICIDESSTPVASSVPGFLYTGDETETPLVPVGGKWSGDVSVQAFFSGLSLNFLAPGVSVPVEVSGDEFSLSGGITMSLNKETGVLDVGGSSHGSGVLLMASDGDSALLPYVAYGALSGGTAFVVHADDDESAFEEPWAEEFPVTVVFDANGATSGTVYTPVIYSFAGSAEVASYVSSSFAKSGYEFAGWRSPDDTIVQPGDIVAIGAFDTVFAAEWRIPGMREAVGAGVDALSGISLSGGDAPWYVVSNKSSDGDGKSLRSGEIGGNETTARADCSSVFSATAMSSGTLMFDWSVQCDEQRYAALSFAVNGTVRETISGVMHEWATVEVDVSAGDELTWTFAKKNGAYNKSQGSVGEDCGWVDNFRFGGDSGAETVPVRFDIGDGAECSVTTAVAVVGQPFGNLPVATSATRRFTGWTMEGEEVTAETIVPDVDCVLVAQWDLFVWTVSFDANGADNAATATPAAMSNKEGQLVHIPGDNGLRKAGYAFQGWSDGMGGIWNDEDYPVEPPDRTFTALWSLDIDESVLGPGASSFAFDTSGDACWDVDNEASSDGDGKSMRSGRIGGDGLEASAACSSVLSATAKSSGTLMFDWTVQCDDYQDFATLSFAVNGTVRETIHGVMEGWATVEVDVSAGDELTWTFAKKRGAYNKSRGTVGEDCGWVDNFCFGQKTTVTFFAEGGSPETSNVVAFAGQAIGELPYPVWPNYSLDYWETPDHIRVDEGWIVPESSVTLTAVTKAKEWRVTYNLAGGTAVTVSNESYVAGASFALPGADSAEKDGYALAGWTDGAATYAPGAVRTVPGGADLAFIAVWEIDYAAILKCSGQGIGFASSGDLVWIAAGNEGDEDGTLQSGWIVASQSSVFRIKVPADGTLAFEWRTSFDNGGSQYAYCEMKKNADVVDSVSTAQVSNWTRREFTLNAGDEVLLSFVKGGGAYSKPASGAGEDRVLIKSFVWTPDKLPEYEFTVNWAADAGVLGARYSIEDGDQDVEAVNGEAIAVPDGKKITVVGFADTNNWYYITGETNTFDSAGSTTITAAKRSADSPGTAEEVGLSGAFADADVNVVSNVMSWAQANGKTVADVNAMTFGASGDPVGVDAEAYLLNCAPADVATEAAKFKVTSFSVDASGNISITPADGDAYGNGSVEVRYSSTPGGEYTTTKPVGSKCFIKVFLVK